MTVSEMVQQLLDRLGLTTTATGATVNRLTRAVNLGKDRLVAAHKWPWLETSTTQLFTSGTRVYNIATEAQAIISIEGSTGVAIRKIERDTYDEMHRPDTGTAAGPSCYSEQGRNTAGRMEIHVWPNPSANSTGRLRFIASVPDISSAGSAGSFDRIPVGCHKAIVEAAVCEYYKQQGLPDRAALANQQFSQELEMLTGRVLSPVLRDGSEQ